jgi:hypothetical protein
MVKRVLLALAVAVAVTVPAPAQATTRVVYGGRISSATVMLRAADWLRRAVPYSQDNRRARWDLGHGRRYRSDCSGFVSMAWALDPNRPGLGRAPVTWELPAYATRTTWSGLRSGDILLKLVPGHRGGEHVELFERWADPGRARAWVFAESSRAHGMRHLVIDGLWTLRNGYVAYRYRRIH